MKKILMTCATIGLLGGTAAAQDWEEGGGGMGGGMSAGAAAGAGGEGPGMGIAVGFNSASGIGAARLLYNVGGNYLDLAIGVDLINISPEGGDSTTVFELNLDVGYRMYNDMSGRIHPYLEPFVGFGLSTDEADGEPKTLRAGAMLGVDFMLFDQFTLGTSIGGALQFTTTEGGSLMAIGLFTTAINATFWWG